MVCASANVCESKYECVGTERVSVGVNMCVVLLYMEGCGGCV